MGYTTYQQGAGVHPSTAPKLKSCVFNSGKRRQHAGMFQKNNSQATAPTLNIKLAAWLWIPIVPVLLMEEILHQLRLVVYPIIYQI